MNKLYTFFGVLAFSCLILLSKEKASAFPANESYFATNSVDPSNDSRIQAPVIPPFYFISKEDASAETVIEFGHNQFVFVQTNRLVPNNFSFKKDLSLTSILIDYKMPVPIYIRGHALRH